MKQFAAGVSAPDDLFVRTYEQDNSIELVADIGAPEATIDVLHDCVIVNTTTDQYEFSIPAEEARTFMKNGVLTIQVEK